MRISHSHKFIFLATPRTGSTTARKVLDKYTDIASVHISMVSSDFPFYHHISALELKTIFEDRDWDWDSYEKFCFVRNPYDRVVSLYHHHLKMRKNLKVNSVRSFVRKLRYMTTRTPSFRDYVMNINPKNRLPTSLESFLCDGNGDFLVNEVLMFEELEDELPKFLSKLDISITADDIPYLNASTGRQQYSKYYDEELKNKVRDLYEYEFDRFGYSF
ncbi:MAG: sulfotransferase family protein [Gammaproteobacteria bacterium]|nr:sulfotransferase family protein [Gammaproteobacteria bacterium]